MRRAAAWAMAYEYDGSSWQVTATRRIEVAQELEIGRGGEMPLGALVPDALVSRRAVHVTATEHGWNVAVSNRNGAILHPWCLPAQRARNVERNWTGRSSRSVCCRFRHLSNIGSC